MKEGLGILWNIIIESKVIFVNCRYLSVFVANIFVWLMIVFKTITGSTPADTDRLQTLQQKNLTKIHNNPLIRAQTWKKQWTKKLGGSKKFQIFPSASGCKILSLCPVRGCWCNYSLYINISSRSHPRPGMAPVHCAHISFISLISALHSLSFSIISHGGVINDSQDIPTTPSTVSLPLGLNLSMLGAWTNA